MGLYRPFGWEVLEHRYAAVEARLQTAADRIADLVAGRVAALEELEPEALRFTDQPLEQTVLTWSRISTPCATYVVGER
jgi:hypothetical protein